MLWSLNIAWREAFHARLRRSAAKSSAGSAVPGGTLLLSLDRLSVNQLTMTQELIANMLGVRREGVTEAAGKLQKLGVIEYNRGQITVLDRPRLEQLCCECYAVVKRESDRLLPSQALQ
jgi:CRP-like cAMP-binding protein